MQRCFHVFAENVCMVMVKNNMAIGNGDDDNGLDDDGIIIVS